MNKTDTTEQTTIDPQAADVGTTGQQIPEAELGMSIPDAAAPKGSEANPLTEADAAADLAGTPRPDSVVIVPTVGRKVWFFPNGGQFHSTPKDIDGVTPMDADVVYVWGDRMVNLTVKDHIGQVHAFTSVPFVQPGDDIYAPGMAYATWMPYQVATARAAA